MKRNNFNNLVIYKFIYRRDFVFQSQVITKYLIS